MLDVEGENSLCIESCSGLTPSYNNLSFDIENVLNDESAFDGRILF